MQRLPIWKSTNYRSFSRVDAGESSTQEVTLTNPGGQALTIGRISLSTDMDEGLLPSDAEFCHVWRRWTHPRGRRIYTVSITFNRGAEDETDV